jgi:acetyl-CoA carboxylase biotin carboxylase subunit
VWGEDRAAAIARSRAALAELEITGVDTSIGFHRRLLDHPTFVEGRFTTNLLDRVGSAAFAAATA